MPSVTHSACAQYGEPAHERRDGPLRQAARAARHAHRLSRRRHGHDAAALRAGRGRVSRCPLRRLVARSQGQQRPADVDPARRRARGAPQVPRGRRRRDRDEHVQFECAVTGRLRHGIAGAGTEPVGGTARARRCRRRRRRDRRAALRRRRAGADQPHRIAVARRQRPGLPEHRLRNAGRDLRGRRARADRRRRRFPDDRDGVRHAERQGRRVCDRPTGSRTGA